MPSKEVETAAASGSAPNVRWHVCKDGRRVFIQGTVSALRDAGGRLVGFLKIGQDITQRRQAEERQQFLLDLSDALRPLADPVAIQGAVARAVGEFTQAHWAYYLELDEQPGEATVRRDYTAGSAPSMVGKHPPSDMSDLVDALRSGISVFGNPATMPLLSERAREQYSGMGMRSFICVPVVKGGEVKAALTVADIVERNWDPFRDVLEEVAERTWQAVERASAEANLRESEERFRQFGENSTDVLWIVNAQTRQLEYVSPAFETIWGEKRDGVMGDIGRWAELVHPQDRTQAEEAMPRLLNGETLQIDYRVIRPGDGVVRWIVDTGFPIRDGAGRVTRVAGIAQDLTDRRLAEEQVRDGRRRLRALVEGIPQLVWRAAKGGYRTWASPQWTDYTGLSDAASRGFGWLEALHPDDRARTLAAWAEADTNQNFDAEHRLCHARESHYRWFRTRAAPVRDEAGVVVEWLGTSTDIDDLRRMQDEQRVLLAELQHRSRNLLAIIRSTAARTLTPGLEVDQFAGRLAALSRVQGFLARSDQFTDRLPPWRAREVRTMSRTHPIDLTGRLILVVEDEYLIADEMAKALSRYGADVLGPVSTVALANELIAAEGDRLHGAVLDLNLSGEMVFPVADALRARGVPFLFATGYNAWNVPERYVDVPRCEKPVDMSAVARELSVRLCAG